MLRKAAGQVNLDESHAKPGMLSPPTPPTEQKVLMFLPLTDDIQFTQPNVHVSWNILIREKTKRLNI